MGIVLASASPRRRELLEMLGFREFRIIPADTSEEIPSETPDESVRRIALMKAREVSAVCSPNDLIIAADTLVFLDGEALGKPENEVDAKNMLLRLSHARHSVYTGVALLKNGKEITFAEKTDVFFRELSEAEILTYIKTGEPMDKAGAYGAQGLGAIFIERIEGDFFNVMGLPLCRLAISLRQFGYELPVSSEGT